MPVLRTYPLIRIWHAGCATGEEAYASAIVLTEEALYDRAQIYATDLSAQAVAHAKQGMCAAAQLGNFAKNYQSSGGRSDFSNYYTVFQHDLVSDHVFGEMHVIFCRNVFIYFGPELRVKVLDKFAQSICTGGFLCLGSSERLLQPVAQNDFSEFSAEDRIYRQAGTSR